MTAALISTCVGGRRALGITVAPELVAQVTATTQIEHEPLSLTPREAEVLDAVIKTGFCKLAARALGLSVKTIETHMLHMRTKNGHDSNYQLIAAYVTAQLKGNQ